MKITIAQMEVTAGNIRKNLNTMLTWIDRAKSDGIDLIAFPEMCLSGYLVGDQWLCDGFCRDTMDTIDTLAQASDGIAIAWGNVFVDTELATRVSNSYRHLNKGGNHHPNKDGRVRRYNAAHVFQNGLPAKRATATPLLPEGIAPKALLPNYRFFDDQRYFFSLEDIAKDFGAPFDSLVQPFLIRDKQNNEVPILFEICEDLWIRDYRLNGAAVNVTQMGITNGAQLVINLSASPWTYGKNNARDRRVKFLQKNQQDRDNPFVPFFYVNCVGVQNNGKNFITFDGDSTIYNAKAEPVLVANEAYQESLLTVDTLTLADKPVLKRAQKKPIAEKYAAIIAGIGHLKAIGKTGEHPHFVIGLSGGVDSAVCAALLVQAVGAEKVVAVNMPSQWNSPATQQIAKHISQALEIDCHIIPIDPIVQRLEQSLTQHFLQPRGEHFTALGKENLQAKIRGTDLLSNIAGNQGWVFTNNGNKLEIALGYATLYGDMGGAIAPIGDLLKTEVFALAHYLNDEVYKKTIIPESLLPDDLFQFRSDQIEPSAELSPAQIDPMKFGYHDALLALVTDYTKWSEEDILIAYQVGTLHQHIGMILGRDAPFGLRLMQRWGVDQAEVFIPDLNWFYSALESSVFKRVQAPGIIVTSKSAFGFDIRESMLPRQPSQRVKTLAQTMENYRAAQ